METGGQAAGRELARSSADKRWAGLRCVCWGKYKPDRPPKRHQCDFPGAFPNDDSHIQLLLRVSANNFLRVTVLVWGLPEFARLFLTAVGTVPMHSRGVSHYRTRGSAPFLLTALLLQTAGPHVGCRHGSWKTLQSRNDPLK